MPGGASANIHRNPQRDDGYESENFGDLKCVNSSVHMRQVYAQTGLGRGNKGNKSRTNKHFFPGMDRSLKLGQDAGSGKPSVDCYVTDTLSPHNNCPLACICFCLIVCY